MGRYISRASTWTARLVDDWRLTEDSETLTDNQYLLLHLFLPRRGTSHDCRLRALPLVRSEVVGHHAYIKKRVLKKMDKDMLTAAAHIATRLITPSDLNAIEVKQKGIRMQQKFMCVCVCVCVCDLSMTILHQIRRKSNYWWSHIEALRFTCPRTRPDFQRSRRSRIISGSQEQRQHSAYKEAASFLFQAIKEVKHDVWEELIRAIERDTCGRP